MTFCESRGVLTGRTVNLLGMSLPEAKAPGAAEYSTCEVDGVAYYVFELGGFLVGATTISGTDYGGNLVHGPRTAPASRLGIAAPLRGLPIRVSYGAPEIAFAN